MNVHSESVQSLKIFRPKPILKKQST